MMTAHILFGVAALLFSLSAWDYIRHGTVHGSRRTLLLVAVIFVVIAAMLKYSH